MTRRFRIILTSLILLSSGFCQERGGTDPRLAVPLLKQILAREDVSGSLAYWGRCEVRQPYPDFPALSAPPTDSVSAVEILRKVFANDPQMQVMRDPNGVVRMFETDVPTDLLDVMIGHISFGRDDQKPDRPGGPNNAMLLILFTPEVIAYRKAHNIGPVTDVWNRPGDSASKQKVSGDLYDVTVKQALDYILQFYPGFWIYENCQSDKYKPGRYVFFGFFENSLQHTNSGAGVN